MTLLKPSLFAFVILVAVVGASSFACSSTGGGAPSAGTTSSGEDAGLGASSPGSGDGGSPGVEDAPVMPSPALLRIAHVSPDLPALDVCVAPHGTSAFDGPLLAQRATFLGGAPDGAAPGLAYAQVSAYVCLAPGRYDVRIVAAGALSCDRLTLFRPSADDGGSDAGATDDAGELDAGVLLDGAVTDDAAPAPPADAGLDAGGESPFSLLPDVTTLGALAFDTSTTLLVAGELAPASGDAPLAFALLPDDAVLASGAALLRAVNALPTEPALDFGFASPGAWLPLFADVAFGASSARAAPSEGALDPNGYLPIAPVAGQAMSARTARADAATDAASASDLEVEAGGIATVIAIGGRAGDTAHPPALLFCTDGQPAGGLLSDCRIAP